VATLAVARLTFANALRQPLTWMVLLIGLGLLGLSYVFGMFSFSDENRMRLLSSSGLAAIVICGTYLGVVGVATAVHDELSSRTALTLFAKPMSRGAFLVGKALGLWATVLVVDALLLGALLGVVSLANQAGFDLLEMDVRGHAAHHYAPDLEWVPYERLIQGALLAAAGQFTLVCLGAALALRLPLVANALVCFAVFVLANLLGQLGAASTLVLPALHLFTIDDAIHFQDIEVTPAYFTICLLSAGLYGAACLLVGLAGFARQDIP
jgi:ABC-type transport system involved in multi-copper enzyme maturation permease subunit